MTGNTPFPAGTKFPAIFEAAAIMRVSKRTAYRLMHVGGLEAIKVSRFSCIPEHAVKSQVRQ